VPVVGAAGALVFIAMQTVSSLAGFA
jgi:hypothetical protein